MWACYMSHTSLSSACIEHFYVVLNQTWNCNRKQPQIIIPRSNKAHKAGISTDCITSCKLSEERWMLKVPEAPSSCGECTWCQSLTRDAVSNTEKLSIKYSFHVLHRHLSLSTLYNTQSYIFYSSAYKKHDEFQAFSCTGWNTLKDYVTRMFQN